MLTIWGTSLVSFSSLATMKIHAVSGDTVAVFDEEELGNMVASGMSVGDLKRLLAPRVGYPRFRQRLVSEEIGETCL